MTLFYPVKSLFISRFWTVNITPVKVLEFKTKPGLAHLLRILLEDIKYPTFLPYLDRNIIYRKKQSTLYFCMCKKFPLLRKKN